MEEAPKPTTPAKEAPAAPEAAPKPKRRWIKYAVLAAIVVVLAAAGAGWWASLKNAAEPATIPTAADQIVLEYRSPQPDAVSRENLPLVVPEPAVLYGDGLLVCGGLQKDNPASPFYFHSAQLSRSQVKQFIKQVQDAGFTKLKSRYNKTEILADQISTSIAVNYVKGGRFYSHASVYYDGPKPALFATVEKVIQNRCGQTASPYRPDNLTLSSRPASPSQTKSLPAVAGQNWPLSDEGAASTIITGSAATQIYQAFGANSHALVSQNGKTYEAQVVPRVRTVQQPQELGEENPDVANAGGTMAVRYIWFIGSDQASSSTQQTAISSIATSVYNFYKSQVGNRSYTWSGQPQIMRGQQPASYYTTCHQSGGCINSDDAVFHNLLNELKSRGIKPGNESVIVMTSFPSTYGPAYCSGLGGPDSVAMGDIYHDAGGFGIVNGNNSCLGWYAEYQVPAHEMGHAMGLAHTCGEAGSLMENSFSNCWFPPSNASWPGSFHINSTQAGNLYAQSLAFNHRINGTVTWSNGTPISGVTVNSCNGVPGTTTDSNGYFELRTTTQHLYCVWISGSMLSGHTVKATGDNPEHAGATDYQNQVAGYNCHNNTSTNVCTSTPATETWDRAQDDGANFTVY